MKKVHLFILGFTGLIVILLIVFSYPSIGPLTKNQTTYGSGFNLGSCDEVTEKDIYELCTRIYDNDPEEFEAVLFTNKFHQHVGPNNIYGAKMALYAKSLLDGKNHEISVLSEAGTKPPISCLNDGIMVAIASTFGRGLITNIGNSSTLAATFQHNNKSVRLEVKPEILKITQEYIANSLFEYGGLTDGYFKDVRKMALYVWENTSQEDLFIITYPEQENNNCAFSDINLNAYFNRLHNFLHTTLDEQEILDFIKDDPCVWGGAINVESYPSTIESVWKSNNKTLIHSL